MHILLVHQYFLTKNGSGGSRFNEMVKSWVDDGHDVTVLAGMVYHNSGKKYEQFKGRVFHSEYYYKGLRVVRCHDSEGGQLNFMKRLWVYLSFVFTAIYAGVFKTRDKYDVILVTSPPLTVGLIALTLSFIKRLPFVFEIRDLWPESAIDTGVLKSKSIIRFAYWLEAKIYSKAKIINVLTPAFRENLLEKNVPEEKIVFIPNAADFSMSERVSKNFDREGFRKYNDLLGKTVITYVGAHGIANHLIQVIETAELVASNPRLKDVLFLLIGDGMEKEMLVREVKSRKLANVKFIPPVSKNEVFEFLLASDFGMSVLKKVDTFKTVYSNKTFDYMSCKIPIFMLIDGVSRKLVENAQCGIYVEPENPMEFYNAIIGYLEIPIEERKSQGKNGYDFAIVNFHRSKLAKRYINYIEEKISK